MPRSKSRLRDWLFSGPGKHRLLEELFLDQERSWSRNELARAARQHPKARMDKYLGPLIQAGVLRHAGGRYFVVRGHQLAPALRDLLRELQELPDDDLH